MMLDFPLATVNPFRYGLVLMLGRGLLCAQAPPALAEESLNSGYRCELSKPGRQP